MEKPEPTLHEHLYFGRHGKLAPSFLKRRKEWLQKNGKAELDGETSEPVEVPDVDELDDEFLALPEDTEFPYKIKGGWHYLSNGEKVNGKANAEKAQAELDGE